ncbi:MAG: thiamine pyrophosphate-dependent enzyme [bacterium]|jgi:2-oxoisovalerate dehydrogenase E1 component
MATRAYEAERFAGLDQEVLIRALRVMLTSRRLDDREILLKRQNRIYFQISGAGHEAAGAAAALVLRPGHDWVYPYYRDRALCLGLGITPEQMLLAAVGAEADPASGGRQMPSHWSSPALNVVTASSPTGTQFLQAVGCAEAGRYLDPRSDSITLVTSGEGATSEGEFWEAINAASLLRLPVLFLIEDNGFAISVPVETQTAGGNIANLVRSFPALHVIDADGTDFIAVYAALRDAAAWCRAGNGPALVHAGVTRPYSHSLSDDERLYKSEAERAADAARDPLTRFPQFLEHEGVLGAEGLRAMAREVDEEIERATAAALRARPPAPETVFVNLYSPVTDITSERFSTPPAFAGPPCTMIDEINRTLAEEMRRDSRIRVFGEDVADCSREENLAEVKGKGGVFRATHGLQREFGSARCFNTPLAEAGIVGRAIGMATRGLKPVAEIQFFDYIWPAMMQLRSELATIRWRSNGGFSCPAVIRVAIGGYLHGGSIYHSQSGEVAFTHIPGLRVAFPSNALDACGLLRTALRADDPVLFLEHKRLYRDPHNRSQHPGADFMLPFGRANVVKAGRNLTIITYGMLVHKALTAAAKVERRRTGVSIEVIDLRTLAPYDWEAIAASVRKTSRVLVAHEDTLSWGYGAEIAARIADELFEYLDAPVRRIGALDAWIGYSPTLEEATLPQVKTLAAEAERLLAY